MALSLVKRLVERKETVAITKAKKIVEAARVELSRVKDAQAAKVRAAREIFEAEFSDANADLVVKAERRQAVMVDEAEKRLAKAEAELGRLEAEAVAEHLSELDRIVDNVTADVLMLETRAVTALAELAKLARERDHIIARALDAEIEATKIRGGDRDGRQNGRHQQIRSRETVLREQIKRIVGYEDLRRALSLLEPPSGPFGGCAA